MPFGRIPQCGAQLAAVIICAGAQGGPSPLYAIGFKCVRVSGFLALSVATSWANRSRSRGQAHRAMLISRHCSFAGRSPVSAAVWL